EIGIGWKQRVKYLPFIMALGIGMCISQAKAVMEGLVGHQSEFTRTPKLGVEGARPNGWSLKKYKGLKNALPLVEIVFGIYLTLSVWVAFDRNLVFSLPFLV